VYFDLNNPKILSGFVIGGALPYFLPALPATLTKWLLFMSILKGSARPSGFELCAVAIAEPSSLGAAVATTGWLPWFSIPGFVVAFAVYSVLAMFANLLLFPSVNRSGCSSLSTRVLYASATGLIYLGYAILVFSLLFYFVVLSHPE
jgi:hypothetical protein